MAAGDLETELKYLGADLGAVRRRLEGAGAYRSRPRELEVNEVFDDSAGTLRRAGTLLRLRDRDELTVKTRVADDRFKTRREITVHVRDGDIVKLLAGLGYRVTWRYEKWREAWDLDGMYVTLDEAPFLGNVVEIEGDRDRIDETATRLGLESAATSAETYVTLFGDYLSGHQMDWRDMTFAEADRARLA